MVRLADGVVAGRGLRVWAPGPDGVPVDAMEFGLPPGAAVAVGPDGAEPAGALAELAALVAAAGIPAAGAGVELGDGFRSARLAGAREDRRDAVLAALRVLGADGAQRLGERAGVLVALFGPAATKPVGAAANEAIQAGRWAAVQLACAASDLLGPEQLEEVLRWTAVEAVPQGTVSVLAGQLGQLLSPVSRPRRLSLLRDLWERVGGQQARARRTERRRAVRSRQDRYADLLARYRHFVDEQVVGWLKHETGREPTVAEAARWIPTAWQWSFWLNRTMHDALAATVLLRTAVAVADHGLVDGLARCREQIAAAPMLISSDGAGAAARRVPGLLGLPARPGCYLRDLDHRLTRDTPMDWPTSSYVTQRLAHARTYGLVVRQATAEVLWAARRAAPGESLRDWDCGHLREWRAVAGYSPVRAPAGWDQPPTFGGRATLAYRLRERPDTDPAEVEVPADLLWYAELADALAQLDGHDAAVVTYDPTLPEFDTDPDPPEPEPLRPRLDSVPLAVAGAAQLVSLGGEVPQRARTWPELVDGLLAATVVGEALTGAFPVPAPLAGLDGATVPGTGARLELARDPRQLAEWSAYMGNCIAGPGYLEAAAQGTCVLGAVRDPDGRILVNVELLPRGKGWQVGELRARFNADPDPELAERLGEWLAAVPPAVPTHGSRPARPHARGGPRRGSRLLPDVGERLNRLAEEAVTAPDMLAVPDAVSLRRANPRRLDEELRGRLSQGVPLARVWRDTAARPLATALAGLDPELRARYPQLDLLLVDAPLLSGVRRLARLPGVTRARSVDLVARRLRAALGRLARTADPVLAAAVRTSVDTPLLCALVLGVSAGPVDPDPPLTVVTVAGADPVPGFPESSLSDPDGPWRHAWPDAVELGADPQRVAGLLVPTGWLGPGGWPALWRRAAR